jgi:putative membrane protein
LIENYTDHAANERTYLAWVRTGLAFMAFGLLVERFDLFLRSLPGLAESAPHSAASDISRAAGLVLILLGVVVLAASTFRYLHFKRLIASKETREFGASRTDLLLVAIVGFLGLCMSVYVVAQAFSEVPAAQQGAAAAEPQRVPIDLW